MSNEFDRTVEKIENIRAMNNHLWMNLLRLALQYAPEQAKETLRAITENDREIGGLLRKISQGHSDAPSH